MKLFLREQESKQEAKRIDTIERKETLGINDNHVLFNIRKSSKQEQI